jgi:hypothetical protein
MVQMHIFRNTEKWGGGLMFIPVDNVKYLEEAMANPDFEHEGIYNFDKKFVDDYSEEQHLGKCIDLTWSE